MSTLPFKLNQAGRHHIPRQRRKVTNWPAYDASLRQRGSLTVWFTDAAIASWVAEPRPTRGGQPEYSDLAILTALTLRAVFRLAYRQTEGLIGSVISLLGLDLAVPDHTTLCRRAETLEVPRPKPRGDGADSGAGRDTGPMHLLVDSTGLKLYGAGEWLVEKHGTKRRRSWRKLHLGVDAETGRIVAATLTERDEDDASQVGPLLDQVADPVASFTGDGAYDGRVAKFCGVYPALSLRAPYAPPNRRWPMILSAIAEKLKRRSKDDFKGRHFEAAVIRQGVVWFLRCPLSYRDIEELFLERGLEVDHSPLNRWVLAYAPLIERRLRAFRKPHCGSIRVDETYIKIRGQWRYLYRAIDKHGTSVDFLLTAKRDLDAAKRFFRKMLKDQPLLSPDRIGTHGAGSSPPAIAAAKKDRLLARTPVHSVTKHLQQGIESDHFRVKRPMPRVGCLQSFHTARRTIQGFEAMLWLGQGFGFSRRWAVCEQNRLLAICFGLPEVNKV